jgi:hypothetical protein
MDIIGCESQGALDDEFSRSLARAIGDLATGGRVGDRFVAAAVAEK